MNVEAGSKSLTGTGNHVQRITLPTNNSHLSVIINCENGFAPTSVVINLAKPNQETPPANGDNSRDVSRADCTSNSKGSTVSVPVVKSTPAPPLNSSNRVGSASKGTVPVAKTTLVPTAKVTPRATVPVVKSAVPIPSVSSTNRSTVVNSNFLPTTKAIDTATPAIGGQAISMSSISTQAGSANAKNPIALTVDSETESCTSSDSRADFESDEHKASTPSSIQEVETQVMLDRLYNYNENELAEFRAELRRNGISPKSSSAIPEIEAQVLHDMKKARKNFKEVETMPATGASLKRKHVDDREVVPDSRAGSPEAIPLPLPTVSSARLNSGRGSAVASAPSAGRYRLSDSSPFRDTSPVDLDSPETRRRKVEGKRKVQERMKQPPPVGRTRGKRPVSLELVPFVTGMSASGSGPARKQTAMRGEKMVKTRI
ncbi:hypothetical protein SCHPADRAFT_883424 [Schizopora paradoxa]|uniref:Uncharacterized protein n=1 Tax=Schizopora paradoxa TaxID=27342 RepID=A0A0H2RLU5_9AGAM|nr:hypothetical protein SCHPADRAFT_883424 [Schizopora paradoxa]